MKQALKLIGYGLVMFAFGLVSGLAFDWIGTHKKIADYRWSMTKAGVGRWETNAEGSSRFIVHEKYRRH